MLCLDLVTITRGEDGDSESWLLVDEMIDGWCVEGWDRPEVVVCARSIGEGSELASQLWVSGTVALISQLEVRDSAPRRWV